MRIDHEVRHRVQSLGELCSVNTSQAAAILGSLSEKALRKQRETGRLAPDGYARVPFLKAGEGKSAVSYRVTDLLRYANEHNSNGLDPFLTSLAQLMGADFCMSIGIPYTGTPTSLGPKSGTSPQAPMAPMPGLGALMAQPASVESRNRTGGKNTKAMAAAQRALDSKAAKLGVRVSRNICRFGSLFDFLAYADLDEDWLFCCPPDSRPYDAIAAIINGPTDYEFKWLSLRKYLSETRKWALHEQRTREAKDVAEIISDHLKV